MRRRFTVTMLLAGALSVVAPAAVVVAQGQIPVETIRRTVLNPDEVRNLGPWAKERVEKLADPDAAVMKRARDELLTPLKDLQVSVAFRQAFSDAAVPELRKLMGHPQDVVVVNALRVAAETATSDASVLLEEKLGDSKVAVRFAAVNGIDRTMMALANRSPAIPAPRVEQLVERLGRVASEGANPPEVMDAAVRALITARTVKVGAAQVLAVRTLASSIGAVAGQFAQKVTPPAVQLTLLRAAEASRNGLGDIRLALGTESVKDSAALSGHLLTWAFCQLRAGTMPSATDRETATQIVNLSETTIILACQRMNAAVEPQKLADDYSKAVAANDNMFIRNVPKLISPLRAAPFGLTDPFLTCK